MFLVLGLVKQCSLCEIHKSSKSICSANRVEVVVKFKQEAVLWPLLIWAATLAVTAPYRGYSDNYLQDLTNYPPFSFCLVVSEVI